MLLYSMYTCGLTAVIKRICYVCYVMSANSVLSRLTDNSESSRRLEIDTACKEKQMPSANVF